MFMPVGSSAPMPWTADELRRDRSQLEQQHAELDAAYSEMLDASPTRNVKTVGAPAIGAGIVGGALGAIAAHAAGGGIGAKIGVGLLGAGTLAIVGGLGASILGSQHQKKSDVADAEMMRFELQELDEKLKANEQYHWLLSDPGQTWLNQGRESFARFDHDGDGFLNLASGQDPSKNEQVQVSFLRDLDDDGKLSRTEHETMLIDDRGRLGDRAPNDGGLRQHTPMASAPAPDSSDDSDPAVDDSSSVDEPSSGYGPRSSPSIFLF